MRLVSELDNAGHDIESIYLKHDLGRGFPKEFDVTAEVTPGLMNSYHQSVSKLIIIETRLKDLDSEPKKTMVTERKADNRESHKFGKMVPFQKVAGSKLSSMRRGKNLVLVCWSA